MKLRTKHTKKLRTLNRRLQSTRYSHLVGSGTYQPRTQPLHCFYRDQWQLINAKPLSYTITGGAARQEKVKPKTWRISASADATWYLRLQVFTTDQPRCYAFDKVFPPLVFAEKNCGFSVFGTILQEKIPFFRLLKQELVKIMRKCFF